MILESGSGSGFFVKKSGCFWSPGPGPGPGPGKVVRFRPLLLTQLWFGWCVAIVYPGILLRGVYYYGGGYTNIVKYGTRN